MLKLDAELMRGFSSVPRRSACFFLALCMALGSSGCEKTPPARGSKNPRVIVTKPITDTVLDYQDFTGRLDAVKTVEIRARVSGYVMTAPGKEKGVVQEGETVNKGELLFQIDVRPYKADLNQAEANLKLALADCDLQKKNAERARVLLPSNAISKEEYETVLAAKEKSEATVGAMEAAKERAQLYLDYTRVVAPVSGRISRRFVDPGNLITADSTVLTTIVTEDPMYAYFDVDERTYLDLLASVSPGQASWGLQLPVMMRLANEKEFDRVGTVDFVDNRVIANTGTVRVRGRFQNPSGLLKAGLFTRIRLPLGSPYKAIVIPDEAIMSDQERKYVWVVNAKNEVEYRSVKLGQSIRDLRVVRNPDPGMEGKEGLTENELIIVSGMQRVRNGIQVDVETQASPAAPEMPLVRLWVKRSEEIEGRR
jgi:multidrug efflux system membrane fusion protein